MDIQRWGLQAAKQRNLDDFQASITWLLEFKKRHGICSRKITNIVTKSEINYMATELIPGLRNAVRSLLPFFPESVIFCYHETIMDLDNVN